MRHDVRIKTTTASNCYRHIPAERLAGSSLGLIGREPELTAVAELIASHRLVTVIGAGGGSGSSVG